MSRPRSSLRLRILLVAGAFLASSSLPSGAEKADKEKPINLEADRVNIDDAKKVSVFEGNVVLTQGTLVIRADRMIVREDAQGFNHGTAYGNPVTFRQKREGVDEYIEGEALRVEYDGRVEKLQLFNRAQLKRGADEVRGSYISYDQPTEIFNAVGSGDDGSGKAAAQGRVRAVIQPKNKDKDKPQPAPALSLKPAPALTDSRK
jgi:lipopolysaccharide export system protein LptA